MLKHFLWLAVLPLLFSCNNNGNTVQGNGMVVEDQRSLEDFSAINVEGSYEIVLVQGPAGLLIQTDSNLLSYIQTEVKRNTLRLSSTENLKGSDGIMIRISYPELEKLTIGGAAKITGDGPISGRDLEIEVKGAAMVELDVDVRKLELQMDGASSLNLNGTAQQLDARLEGAGNLAAYDLQVRDASIHLSGIGGAQVFVTDNLQARVSGVGGIRYRGNPQNIQRKVSGVGSIEPASADEQESAPAL
ncbi:head GIN domain-containing protein [Cesiribacter andamanensis]|uniref:Putative auto-transporter adhesin head GIN domain-containing protein n=1 Tax=Cesiribacter andamanensis AMV16 TaxID=1279009 RepID=M7NAX3_9BACT|nr:head GIN domain-containing protein [Cesiribacter andamanensis]EMR04326.1 hypothetical protein ADICEAN_00489 [Cesiribacter andamanensis AMV16]